LAKAREATKMGYSINWIACFLERVYKPRQLYKVKYDLETGAIVVELLQNDKSGQAIMQAIPVSD